MPFEADTAGSRFKKVLRDALRVFPTKNPAALREAMQNDSSSEEGSDDDDDGFSDAGEEMALLVGESEGKARDAYRATCAEKLVLPSSRALVSFRADACDVRSTHLGDRAVEALAAAVASHGKLAKLNLASNGVGPAGFDALAAGLAGAGHGLLEADLGGNRAGDAALARVALALGAHCPRLRTLSLASCGMCDGGAGALGRAFRCHADLEVLDVSGSRITSSGCLALSALLRGAGSAEPAGRGPRDGGVVSLNANWNLLGDDGAVACALAGVAAPTAVLLTLDLSYNALGDAAGCGVARALRTNHTLRLLDLSRNRLGAPSAAAWAAAVAAGRHLATLKLGWNRLGTAGSLDIIAACAKAPPVGRTVAPSPLHTLRLENCCGAGHEHALLEAVHTVVAFLSRLNRSAPSIVVEFPDRHRTVVRDCEYGDDELTFLSGARPRLGSDDLSIATSPSMDELTGGPTAPVADRADDADDGSLADASLGGASAKTLSTHASWLSREGDRRKARRRPFSRMLEIPADALSNQKFAPPAPQNEHGRGSMTAAGCVETNHWFGWS